MYSYKSNVINTTLLLLSDRYNQGNRQIRPEWNAFSSLITTHFWETRFIDAADHEHQRISKLLYQYSLEPCYPSWIATSDFTKGSLLRASAIKARLPPPMTCVPCPREAATFRIFRRINTETLIHCIDIYELTEEEEVGLEQELLQAEEMSDIDEFKGDESWFTQTKEV